MLAINGSTCVYVYRDNRESHGNSFRVEFHAERRECESVKRAFTVARAERSGSLALHANHLRETQ